MSIESPPEGEVSPFADLVSAAVWLFIGTGIAIGAWRMDRLENLHINKYEIPGLVPGLLGAAIALLGLVLAARAVSRGALKPDGRPAARRPGTRLFMGLVFAAMLGYSVVLVGHGIPFWLATFVFVSGFIFFFDRERQAGLGRGTAKQAVIALVCGALTSAIVSFAFQEVFYVRLP